MFYLHISFPELSSRIKGEGRGVKGEDDRVKAAFSRGLQSHVCSEFTDVDIEHKVGQIGANWNKL